MKVVLSFFTLRKFQLIFIITDFSILLLLFSFLFQLNNLFVFQLYILFFLVINYICGKYNLINLINKKNIVKYLKKSIISYIIFYLTSFLFDYFFVILEITKKLPLEFGFKSLYIYIACFLFQFTLNIFFVRFNRQRKWIFIGRSFVFDQIIKDINLAKFNNLNIKNIEINKFLSDYKNYKNYTGLIFDSEIKLFGKKLEIIKSLEKMDFLVISHINWVEKYLCKLPTEMLHQTCFLNQRKKISTFSRFQLHLKRFGDIIVSLILILVSSPILLLSILLIKFEDGGPVFYKQIRNGRNKKIFTIIKLRTMRVNAEKDGAKWFVSDDNRVTKIGKILRLFRIDELTQLGQVFSGNMSLIGPRPERPEFDSTLSKELPFYDKRYSLRPGISGWAQVNYPYGSSKEDAYQKLSYDIYYLKNCSIFLDFLILLKTIRLVCNAKGALPRK